MKQHCLGRLGALALASSQPALGRCRDQRLSILSHYQQRVDAHEGRPARVSGTEMAEATGVGVSPSSAHQDSLQLGVLFLKLTQGLLHVTLSF